MPFIHIRSLPFDPPKEMSAILKGITQDFAGKTNIANKHVTVTWEFFLPNHYNVDGKTATSQPSDTHPILVDLLVPNFNDPEMINTMLNSTATSLANRVGVNLDNIFINIRRAHSGRVFDAGEIVSLNSTNNASETDGTTNG